jgi:hypothetical protein
MCDTPQIDEPRLPDERQMNKVGNGIKAIVRCNVIETLQRLTVSKHTKGRCRYSGLSKKT